VFLVIGSYTWSSLLAKFYWADMTMHNLPYFMQWYWVKGHTILNTLVMGVVVRLTPGPIIEINSSL